MIYDGTVKLKYPDGQTRVFQVLYGNDFVSIQKLDIARSEFVNRVNAMRAAQGLAPVERVTT